MVQTRRQGKEAPRMRRGGPRRQQEIAPRARGKPYPDQSGRATEVCRGDDPICVENPIELFLHFVGECGKNL